MSPTRPATSCPPATPRAGRCGSTSAPTTPPGRSSTSPVATTRRPTRLVRDAGAKVYEANQGLTPELAALLGQPAGDTFHFLLNNTVIKDNRIPPRGYTQTAWDQPGLRPVGATYADGQYWDETAYTLPTSATRVTVELWYQTSSTEYIDFLDATGGVAGASLRDLWSRNPSPPVLMAFTAQPLYTIWMPVIARND